MTHFRLLTLASLAFFIFPACAVEHSLSEAFKGNTRRDPRDYNPEARSTYRKYRYNQKIEEKEREEEIIERLKREDERNKNSEKVPEKK